MTLKLLAALLAFSCARALACTNGEARIGKGRNGPALEICRANQFVTSQDGASWYSFFDARKNDKAFVAQVEHTVDMKYDEIMKGTKDVYGKIELYSDDKKGLNALADDYTKWSAKNNLNAAGPKKSPAPAKAAEAADDESSPSIIDGQQ